MRKFYLVFVLCLISVSSCSAQSTKFSASFKDGGQAKTETSSVVIKGTGITGDVQTLFYQAEDSTFESVIEITYTSPVDSSVAGLTAILNKKLFTDSTKSIGTFTSANILGMEGLMGTAITSTSIIHIVVFASGNVLYEMISIIKNTGDQTEAQRFFDSFVLAK
jgi:hypothetical protein